MICMFYSSDQTSCIAYLSSEAVGSLLIMFVVLLGVYGVFKIILRLMGF
ncbi:hypothetical protein SFB21_2822 [Acinetobacter bouvetii]|uniref:Uncharacterized protein n=1 Tax=Acinetobacter bouvetii TaxID=202951 RepID=A0A811GF00_9GAMM|nr:hypothetical protein SFB21_2822 [Acinetobacter bouvetii]